MFERIFRNKVKEAKAEYETELNTKQAAAAHEAELNKKLAERLKHYNAHEDDSVSNFSEIDFKENSDETSDIKDRESNVDVWGQANPAEITQWNKENRAETSEWNKESQGKSDRRQNARRKLDRR
jgi:hypothetical protein